MWTQLLAAGLIWLAGLPLASAFSAEGVAARRPVAALNVDGGRAVKGYDVVAYFSAGRPIKGSPKLSYQWEGATWQFASSANRTAFMRDPGKYAPQYGGYCAFGLSQGITVDIDPTQWKIVNGKLYLNNNSVAQKLWAGDPAGHIAKGDANWRIIPRRHLLNNGR